MLPASIVASTGRTADLRDDESEAEYASAADEEEEDLFFEASDGQKAELLMDRLQLDAAQDSAKDTKESAAVSTNVDAPPESEVDDDEGHDESDVDAAEDVGEVDVDADEALAARLAEESALPEEELARRLAEALQLKECANTEFRTAEYATAEATFSSALALCPQSAAPERAILYSNRAACRSMLLPVVDPAAPAASVLPDYREPEDARRKRNAPLRRALRDCDLALQLRPDYVRCLLRRAALRERADELEGALEDYQKVLALDGGCVAARLACAALPGRINERNERLKTEMMGQLKSLGNMVLKPFGLSTNNFQMQQDPSTGGYSVNFVQ